MKLAFVCVGAGSGRRFGADKLAEPLGDSTVLESSVASLATAFPEAPLVVVVASDRLEHWRSELATSFPRAELVAGGDRRQDSVRVGVGRAAGLGAEVVAVHDAARPVVHPDDVRTVVQELGDADAAVLCETIGDTVKRVDHDGVIRETISRNQLRLARTPQVVRIEVLERAWESQGLDRAWPDEAAVLERAGFEVRCVLARHPNPKLTTVNDLALIRSLMGEGR
jgi:2-C-methyl-D-erythritol 4-phosphate cytidylyltransferase